MAAFTGPLIAIAVLAVAVLVYVIIPRSGHGYLSRLMCPRCAVSFDYRWLPGGSLSSVRLGRDRYIQCPNCHAWSMFDIVSTRVKGNR